MSKDKLESLVKHMEETLSEMEQLKLHCGKQSEELSQLVGASRERVNKAISKFVRLGWIEQQGRTYVITNRAQLRWRAGPGVDLER